MIVCALFIVFLLRPCVRVKNPSVSRAGSINWYQSLAIVGFAPVTGGALVVAGGVMALSGGGAARSPGCVAARA
jgi:hypothetical protein